MSPHFPVYGIGILTSSELSSKRVQVQWEVKKRGQIGVDEMGLREGGLESCVKTTCSIVLSNPLSLKNR